MMNTKKNVPCIECKDRSATCHAACERYAAWKKGYNAEKEKIQKEKNAVTDEWSYKKDRYRRLTDKRN